jgi:hypothetical protein
MTLSKLHDLYSVKFKNDSELFRRCSHGLLKILSQHPPVVTEKDNGMLVADGSKDRKLNCFIRHKEETSRCFNMEQVCQVVEDVGTLQRIYTKESAK